MSRPPASLLTLAFINVISGSDAVVTGKGEEYTVLHSACLHLSLCVLARVFQKDYVHQTTKFLSLSPVAMVWFSFDFSTVLYAFLVLWMT